MKHPLRKIFSFGGTTAHTTVETPKRTRIGFNSPQSESNTEDEFFCYSSRNSQKELNRIRSKENNSDYSKEDDDFFDNNSNRVGDHQPTKRTTNDDFNF